MEYEWNLVEFGNPLEFVEFDARIMKFHGISQPWVILVLRLGISPVQGVVSGVFQPPAACRSDTSAQLVGHQRRMSKIKNKNIRLLCTVLLYYSMQDTCNSTESVCCDMMSLEDNGAS